MPPQKCHDCPNFTVGGKRYCFNCTVNRRQRIKAYRQRKVAKGLCRCSGCSRMAEPGTSRCRTHLDEINAQMKAKRERQKQAGLCSYAGCKCLPMDKSVHCRRHWLLHKIAREKHRWRNLHE